MCIRDSRETERQRQRDRDRDRETERQRDRDRDRETERDRDRDRETERVRQTGRQADRQRQRDRQTDRDSVRVRQRQKQRQRQRDRQTETERQSETERDRDRDGEHCWNPDGVHPRNSHRPITGCTRVAENTLRLEMAGCNTSNIIVRTPRIPQSIFGHGRLLPTPPGLPHPSTHPYSILRDFGATGGGGVGRG